VLQRLPQRGDWLFQGKKTGTHISTLKPVWGSVCRAAGVTGATLHDVRRTYGLQVARVAGLHVASKLLRHSSVKITEAAYAPLGLAELLRAAEKVDASTAENLLAFEKKASG
jgi:integrase